MATSNTLDFLAANNLCGRTLLNLVSRGNAVIAELLRLADRVPSDFTNPASSRYPELLLDFTYFSQTDAFEAKLEQSQRLRDLDEELRETHIDLLIRYFLAFESVRSYVADLNKYVEDLEDETFLQQNLESVLSVSNIEGKQLLTESLYLYGVMLMVLDQKLPGQTRERLLVAYHRFNAQRSALYSDIDEVVALLRSTGYNAREKRPVNYPENYFHRVPLKRTFVEMVVGRLRSDDLYNQIASFPLPDHRSTALAPQAAMIYVCLYFQPEILHNQTSVMREIVDKYFPDNWVISVYMGMTVNLVDAWEPYRAAKTALANSLMDSNVKHLASHHGNQIETIVKVLRQFLSEGILTKEYILDNMSKLLKSLRSCNVTLRWLMLHTSTLVSDGPLSKKCAFLRDMVVTEAKFKNALLFELILNVSQFELKLKEKLRQVLAEKDSRCQALQRNISDHLDELAQVFSGDKPLTRVQKNAKLQAWFLQLKTTVEELQFDGQSVESTGRKLVQMCSRLTEVQDLHNLDSHISVRQFLQEINDLMQQLLRTINIKDDKLAQIQTISDLTYAWDIIDQYTPYMQDGIKRDPSMAMKLRATFLKLSSALALPLLRIEQAESPDLVSVSQFYSRELVVYVRRVLQVVPETVFSLLNSIVRLQTDAIHELPTRLDKDKMKEHATLDSRYEMARLTHSISVLTEGILMMKTTLVGIIRVDPKQVLEDGVRRELVQKLSSLMHQTLAFNPKAKQSELEPKLLILAEQMEAVKRSFAYISDYISLSGYRLWQEELTRTIGYAVEQECNAYLTHKILDDDSIYQSRVIPLPKFQPIDGQSATFIGRLIRELLKETDPKTTIFASTLRTWYDAKTKQPRASPQLFKSLKAAISTVGMSGLNRLCGFMIVDRLRRFFVDYRAQFVENLAWSAFLQSMDDSMATSAAAQTTTPQTKLFENAVAKGGKLFAHCIEQLCMIGQLQLIRMHLAREIANTAHFESRQLTLSLQTLNQALLGDIAAHAADPSKPYPAEDNALMYEVSEYLEQSGATDPLLKIYICPPKLPNVACALFFTVLSALPKLTYMDSIGLIAKKPSDGLDGIPFVIGIATLLKQHHPSETAAFINHCAVLVNSFVHSVVRPTSGKPSFDLSADVGMMLSFLAEFSLLAGIRKSDMEAMLPAVLLDHYRACIPTSN